MNPSISTRNFVGGLLGGMAGILLSYYIHPLAIPFGVLVGVVLGWWHTEIAYSIVNAHHRARTVAGGLLQVLDEAISFLGRVCGLPRAVVNFLRTIIVNGLGGAAVWFVTAPARSRRYLAAHPMNKAHAIALTAYLLWMGLGAAIGSWLLWGQPMGKGLDSGGGGLFGAMLGMLVAVMGSSVPLLRDQGKPGEMSWYYRQWEILSRHGGLALFGYNMMRNIRYSIGFTAFVVVAACWGFPLAMAFMLGTFVVFPVLGMVRGFYLAVRRPGHWLCFGVTLVVTGCSWLYFHGQFANDAIVWSVALITGIASGAATELVRRPILAFYSDTRLGCWLAQPLDDTMMGTHFGDDYTLGQHDGYMGIAIALSLVWLGQSKVARCLRALCFGTPVTRPVAIA